VPYARRGGTGGTPVARIAFEVRPGFGELSLLDGGTDYLDRIMVTDVGSDIRGARCLQAAARVQARARVESSGSRSARHIIPFGLRALACRAARTQAGLPHVATAFGQTSSLRQSP